LHVLDDGDRRLRCGQSCKTNERDNSGKHGLHPGNLAVSKVTIKQDCYNKYRSLPNTDRHQAEQDLTSV
jgi:hypothetical protein